MKRVPRVNQLIKKELAQIIWREINFPENVLVTVTRADTSANLIETKVYVSVIPEEKIPQVLKILNTQIYEIQQSLNKRLKMRPIPKIQFVEERATKEAGRIEELIEGIRQKKSND